MNVIIFDTTLRDGEQSPGASLTSREKVDLARQLARLGVDVIEAGFPAASPDDLEGVRRVAREVGTAGGPVICGLARAVRSDIDRCWEAVSCAVHPRIHTFLATSDIHLEHKLGMTRAAVIRQVSEMVAYARNLCPDVEFSCEDACRSDPEFLVQVLSAAMAAGATTLNIPDTVGYTTPEEYARLMRFLISRCGDEVVWSVHCHDDLGLATANTLAGLAAGARQAEVTVNGIGERAGNTALEEVVMALAVRREQWGLTCGVDTTQLTRTSRMVSNYTGLPVQPNKAVVGDNAFSHEAGIHQDGVLKHQATYEIMTPESVGLSSSNLVLGKHSGRHALRVHLEQLGFALTDEEFAQAFRRFKALADRKKTVTYADLEALVTEEMARHEEVFTLEAVQVTCGHPGLPTATVRVAGPAGARVAASVGTGPVDAVYRAMDSLVGCPVELVEYRVNAITEGIDALGEVSVRVRSSRIPGRSFGGHGADTDIIVASAKAYLAALNRVLSHGERVRPAAVHVVA